MIRSEVLKAASAEYGRIIKEAQDELRATDLNEFFNPVYRQYFKNGAWFGYQLAKREQADESITTEAAG